MLKLKVARRLAIRLPRMSRAKASERISRRLCRSTSAFRRVPLRRRPGGRLDSRNKTAIELGNERSEVIHNLLPPFRASYLVLAASDCALGYRKRQAGREPQPLNLEPGGEAMAPGTDVEVNFHGEISGSAAAMCESPGSAAAVITHGFECADKDGLLGSCRFAESGGTQPFEGRWQVMGKGCSMHNCGKARPVIADD